MSKKHLICIVGPTAIGKTALSVSLARLLRTEILSADSRQFFREMSIGTAAPSPEELEVVPHHFIQHRSVEEPYSVGDFEKEALESLRSLYREHEQVVLVGGSGLYVNAIVEGLDAFPEVDLAIRKSLNAQVEHNGMSDLQQRLKELDPEYYVEVDQENPHRVIRALEICLSTGRPYSSFRKGKKKVRPFNTIYIGLTAPRAIIYSRIDQRVDQMIAEGLVEEARNLFPHKNLNALNTVGYKELFRYFEGHWSLEEAISEIKKNTRRFAKRQLTWYRKNQDIHWFGHDTPHEEIGRFVKAQL